MATVKNTVTLQDKMTPVLRTMIRTMQTTIDAMAGVDKVSEKAFKQAQRDIRAASEAIDDFNRQVDETPASFSKWTNPLMGIASGIYTVKSALQGLSAITNFSDEISMTASRLELMNDGLQTTAQLQDMIFNSANASRSAYMDTAAVVSKLGILAGDSFSSNEEMVLFAEQMNKQFKIGGASIQEQTSAMYQLTQAMASGMLQGDEFRSIRENAPLLVKAISDFTGKSIGELKEMGAEGLITADIIKAAMFSAMDETNRKFAELPMTFGQAVTIIKNHMIVAFTPLMTWMAQGAQWIGENWEALVPIFIGLSTAVGLYALMMGISTTATWLAVAANQALLISMLKNPYMWVALAIGAIVGIIYNWIDSVGGIAVAWMQAKHAVLNIIDSIKAGVLGTLELMINDAIRLINKFVGVLNKIPGVNLGVIQEVTFGTQATLEAEANRQSRAQELAGLKAEKEALRAEKTAKAFDFGEISSIASIGEVGKIKDSVSITDEDIKLLKDVAAIEFTNRYTTMRPEVNVNFGDVRETADVGQILEVIEEMVVEAYASSLVGEGA